MVLSCLKYCNRYLYNPISLWSSWCYTPMTNDFSDLESAAPDLLWATFLEDAYQIEDEDEVIDEHSGALVGEITDIEDNVGEYGSRMYTVETDDYDRPVAFWGSGSIDNQADNVNLGIGDTIGVVHTGEMGENENGTFPVYDVRYSKQ